MALTLNTSGLTTTTSSGGASGSAGLTTAEVTSLINTSVEYEYISSVSFVQNANTVDITEGVDSSLYEGYRYVFTDVRFTSASYLYFYLLRSNGNQYSDLYYSTEKNSSSDSFDYNMGGNGTAIYFDASGQFIANDRISGYVNVNNADILNSRLTGKYGMDLSASTARSYEGSFASANLVDYSGIRFASNAGFTSDGRVDIYAKRKRT